MKSGIIGIDEVGRGALAGPVVVAAAMVPAGLRFNGHFGTLKDSKKLSAKQRELWYAHFVAHPRISFAIARIYPRQIEKRNISQAANLAAHRVFNKLLMPRKTKVFLDGGLYLANKSWQNENIPTAKTIIKADEKFAAVKIASIVAKVHRDRFMKKLARRYPGYGFDVHKGYGTQVHLAAITKYGPCAVHRLTFLKKTTTI